MVNEGWSNVKTNSGDEMLRRSNSKGDIQNNNNNNNNSLANELELLLLQKEHQQRQTNLNIFGGERDHSLHRSGSAPPTIEGALSILQDPNFALQNDVLSEEEIRSHPAYLAYYYSNENLNPRLPPPLLSREDWRIAQRVQAGGPPIGGFGDSMFLPQLPLQKVEDELVELRKAAVRNLSHKNSTDFLEGSSSGLPKPAMGLRKKSFADIVQGNSIGETSSELHNRQPSTGSSRNAVTLDSSPGFPAVGVGQVPIEDRMKFIDAKLHDLSTNDADISRVLASFHGSEGVALSNGHNHNMNQHFLETSGADGLLNAANYDEFSWGNRIVPQSHFHREVNVPRRSASLANLQSRFNPSEGSHLNPNGHSLWRNGSPSCSNLHSVDAYQALPRNQPFGKSYIGSSHPDLRDLERMYLEALLTQQQQQQQQQQQLHLPLFYNSGNMNHQSGNHAFGQQHISRMPSALKNQVGGLSPRSRSPRGVTNVEGKLVSSLLEELKNSKGRPPELADVIDNVVEISMDQYGSRFIQQKLETASTEDKIKIFPQIITHARGLMTDVFGNYVIQKFFEHGTESQTKELANQLVGHVLPLSLQMYGCRVIQKALEVVEADQQTKLVSELKGSVMKCVHDQNGNHVIQKCVERIPHERIQFIISSFYGQVVTLSTHPYGCRVIQRVLEHSADPDTRKIIMDEIMESVCTLAQDQYGNYVIQHVLQHGKPDERAEIIAKLAGQIVKMSQQKFASNVIEKCLTFGGPEQRQLLINEMLGSTEENEPLQAMMKDPFGNYVVQKVLETCDDQSRELIISRIKVHLYTLKKYTYGKHIVSRVEKLISSGEKHMGVSST